MGGAYSMRGGEISFLSEKLKGIHHLGKVGVDRRIILEWF
jgi:hypothetical protein